MDKLLVLLLDHRNFKSSVSLSYGHSLQLRSLRPLQAQKAKKKHGEGGGVCEDSTLSEAEWPWESQTLESPLDCKEIKPVTPEGNQSWILVMDRETWHATVHGVPKSWIWLSNWTELNWSHFSFVFPIYKIRDGIGKFLISEDSMFPWKHWELLIPKVEKQKIRWGQNNKSE